MTSIERNVMRRVRIIRFARLCVSGTAFACVVGALALYGIGREVWVARVFANMPNSGDISAVIRFYLSAFENTRLVVQALSIAALGSLVYLARETAQLLGRALTPLQA